MFFKKRVEIIERILEAFQKEDYYTKYNALKALRDGKELASHLKELTVIHPNEYTLLLNQKTNTLENLLETVHKIQETIYKKQEYLELYKDYIHYFLAAKIDEKKAPLDYIVSTDKDYKSVFSLVNDNDEIDYTPYLSKLGIDDITTLHPEFKRQECTDAIPEKKQIKIIGIKATIHNP